MTSTPLRGLPAEWRAFIAQVKAEAERRAEPLVDRVIGAAVVPIDLNVAERLSQAASRVADAEDGELPVYDDSDRDLKVTQVRVAGFRGSAASVTMDLTKQGRPVGRSPGERTGRASPR